MEPDRWPFADRCPRFTKAEVFEIERQTLAPGDVVHRQMGDKRFAEFTADRAVIHAAVRQLVEARLAAGLTLEQVAERAGRSVGKLEHFEATAALTPDWLLISSYARAVECALAIVVSPAADTPHNVGQDTIKG